MMTRETLERLVRELSPDLPVLPEDWEALVPQLRRMLQTVRMLDELPLDDVEPVPLYEIGR